MSNSDPFEILAGPADIYVAPIGTAFPLVNVAPAVDWVHLAKATQMDEAGVIIKADQTVDHVYSLGGTGSRKGFRTRQDLHVLFTLMDATVEAYADALAGQTVVTTAPGAGTAGYKTIALAMPGGAIATKALLVRVAESPYGDLMLAQWEFPRAYNAGNVETKYTKGVPVGLAFDFMVMDDNAGVKGNYRAQNALPV
jgi:hypothetical protein